MRFSVNDHMSGKLIGRQGIQPGISRLGDRVPCLPHLVEGGRGGRPPKPAQLVDFGVDDPTLSADEPVKLFMGSKRLRASSSVTPSSAR